MRTRREDRSVLILVGLCVGRRWRQGGGELTVGTAGCVCLGSEALLGDTGRTAGRVEVPVSGLRPERPKDCEQGRRANRGGS